MMIILIMDYDLQEEQCGDNNGNQHWCQSDKVFFLHHFLILEQKEPFKKNEMPFPSMIFSLLDSWSLVSIPTRPTGGSVNHKDKDGDRKFVMPGP